MSIWQTPLGQNVFNNPLVDSPYVDQQNIAGEEFTTAERLTTENGIFILTEGGSYLTTE